MPFKKHKLYTVRDINIAFILWILLFSGIIWLDGYRISKYYNDGVPGLEIFLLVPWIFNLFSSLFVFMMLWGGKRVTVIPWELIVTSVLAGLFYGFDRLLEFIIEAWPCFVYAIVFYLAKVLYLRGLTPFSQEKYLKNMLN